MSTVLQFQDISKSYGTRRLFDRASVSITEGQRIGFVGANGAGKTTLMRMIVGDETPDSGEIVYYPDTRLGYLEQHETFPTDETVIHYLERISGRESWECAKQARAFDIDHEQLDMPFLRLSGGYQMRVRLTGILLKDPTLLLLDEPTNYLDLQTILLLEEVLRKYRGALLLISHDREFLKNVCTHTLELEHQRFTLFSGNIEAYLEEKEVRLQEAQRHNKKIRAQQRHLQDFVNRFRAKASKATQAQSKLKQLDKLKTIDIAHSIRSVRIHLPDVPQRNAQALECKELYVGYSPDTPILHNINIEIPRGEHMAIVGENGNGKSTLLKTIAGELSPLSGTYKWGHNLSIAYYAQHVPQMLPKDGTTGDYLSAVTSAALPEDVLRMAGNFLFTQDDLEKPISVLSGGERARLCLAAICLQKHDILILDEPTNHLDFDTVEALGEALSDFQGTILFVSHSRTFVSQIATTILEVKDGRAVRYPYPYDIYVHELKTHEHFVEEPDTEASIQGVVPYTRTRTEVYQDLQKEKRAQQRAEADAAVLTKEKNQLLKSYAEAPTVIDIEKAKRLKQVDLELIEKESQWFEHQERIDALEAELKTAKENDSSE